MPKMPMTFDTLAYERNHGARPRGRGNWAFCPWTEFVDKVDYLPFVVWFSGTFGEAKKQAAAHFRAAGRFDIVVCP